MAALKVSALALAAALLAMGMSAPAAATTEDPCEVADDFVGNAVFDLGNEENFDVYWSETPMHVVDLCGDRLEIDDVFFSESAQESTDETNIFSRDAFDSFGTIRFPDTFLADEWTLSGSTVSASMAFDRGSDIQNIEASLNRTGNTLTWTIDNEQGGFPSGALDFSITGDLGSDEETTVVEIADDVWVTHDANTNSDPILVWRATGAAFSQDPEYPDGVSFLWEEDGSVQLEVILVPNVQCFGTEPTPDDGFAPLDDQESFDEALDFALTEVATDFDAFAGTTIDPIGDLSCGAGLADTGSDVATPVGAAVALLVLGAGAVTVRRRRA